MAHSYLDYMQGNKLESLQWEQQALRHERELQLMEIQERYQ